ncbi:hypothetical protein SUGI_0088640 [Cryptomeria japonica]|uniref:uncharacterized protein At4g26450 n=1 Tax=Cryptomeria japonica TaxID=3369 RepID=UPI002408AC3E|nr:uncharacterized protein At4g26450 [Cryptomeria japonica]XP_057863963.1 uncharacterized protein At4g26450 [Cryptomeria japonica]GLJ08433.1 hypothetical protein SUGI_0088640 [Cryptomeria japonica]
MHARHRTPGEGLRANSFGVGQPSVRSGPDLGWRHMSHSSDFKGSGRGVGRGLSKPPSMVRKADIMMEAGRLAAEYLVSQGILSPSSLIHKGQNGNIARLPKECPEVRVREKESLANENGSPNSAQYVGMAMEAISGSSSLTVRDEEAKIDFGTSEMLVGGKRKAPDDSIDGRKQLKDRKLGNFKAFMRDWNLGDSRSGPSLDKCIEFCASKTAVDDLTQYHGEKMAIDIGGVPRAMDSISCKSGVEGDSDSDLENFEFPDTTDSKPLCSSVSKTKESFGTEDPFGRKIEKPELQNCAIIDKEDRPTESGELRDSYWNDREIQNPLHQHFVKTDVISKDSRGSSPADMSRGHFSNEQDLRSKVSDRSIGGVSSNSVDLVQLCSQGQVPTKARSITRHKVMDAEHCMDRRLFPIHGGRNSGEFSSGRFSNNSRDDDLVEESGKSCWNLRGSGSESTRIRANRPAEEDGELDHSIATEKDRFAKSYSFSDRSSFMHQQESSRWPPGFGGPHSGDSVSLDGRMFAYGRSRSMFPQRDMENPMCRSNRWEAKRKREWPPGRISQADEYFRLHNLKAKQTSAQMKAAPSGVEVVFEPVEQEDMLDDKMPEKKDLSANSTIKAVVSGSGSGSNDEQESLSTGSKTVDEKLNLNTVTAAEIEEPDSFMIEKQRASAQISSLLAKIHKGSSNESSLPVVEEGHTTECTQKDEGKVPIAESQPNGMDKEERSVIAFFQDLLKDCPLLRHLYQSRDGSREFDCLVCLSSSSLSERKFSNLAGLLRHAKDDNEMPLMHTGYGHAICELLDLNNSNDPSKDVENVEQCSSQSLQSEEGIVDTAEPITLSLEGLENAVPED